MRSPSSNAITDNLWVAESRAIARERGIEGYNKMRKAELVEAIDAVQTVAEINVPIPRPTNPSRNSNFISLKNLASKATDSVNKEIGKFYEWILSFIPEPSKKRANKRARELKEQVNRIFKRIDGFTTKERQTALKGYLKTNRVGGRRGYGPQKFIANIMPRVMDLINKQKKPIKTKFIVTCKFIKIKSGHRTT